MARYVTVALFTRAWIEIFKSFVAFLRRYVALFTRAWIEIKNLYKLYKVCISRPLHEGVD